MRDRMDESAVNHNRRSRRSPVLLAATVELRGAVHDVKLRNLSEEGALIEGAEGLPEFSAIIFCRKELRARARIAWVQGKYVPSLLAAIGGVVERHLGVDQGELFVASESNALEPTIHPACPQCGSPSLIKVEGCNNCLSCGYSKCG